MICLFVLFTLISTTFCNTSTVQAVNNSSTQNASVNNTTQVVTVDNTRNSQVNIEQQNVVQQTVLSTSTTTTPKPQHATFNRNYQYPHIVVLPPITRTKPQQPIQKSPYVQLALQKSRYSTQSEQIAAQNVQNYPTTDSIQFVTSDIGSQYRDNNHFQAISTSRLAPPTYDYNPYASVYNPYYPINLFKSMRPINPYFPYFYSHPYYSFVPYNLLQSYQQQPEVTTNTIRIIENSTQTVQPAMDNSQYAVRNNDPIVSSVRINNGQIDAINDERSNSVETYEESVENPTTVVSSYNELSSTSQDEPDSAALASNSIESNFDEYVPLWIGLQSKYRILEGPPLGINNF